MTEAHCDCTASRPWPTMIRLRTDGATRHYLCRQCVGVRAHVYTGGVIEFSRCHAATDGMLFQVARTQALDQYADLDATGEAQHERPVPEDSTVRFRQAMDDGEGL